MPVPPGVGLRTGLQEKLYLNVDLPGPTWVEIQIVSDVSLPLEKDKAEVKARISKWKQSMPTLKGAPLDFDMLGDTSDGTYTILRNAYLNDDLVQFAIADQDMAVGGAEAFIAWYYIYGFAIDQKLEQVQMVKVKADLAYLPGSLGLNQPVFVNTA